MGVHNVLSVHGVAAIVETPALARLLEHRGDLGTVVEQDGGTGGWFHIAVTTLGYRPDNSPTFRTTKVNTLYLNGRVNDNAKIDRVHLRMGTQKVFEQTLNIIGRDFSEEIVPQFLGGPTSVGLAVCVHVQFLTGTPRGRFEFHSAALRFSE